MHRCGSQTFLLAIDVKFESALRCSHYESCMDEVHLKLDTPQKDSLSNFAHKSQFGLGCTSCGKPFEPKNVHLAIVWVKSVFVSPSINA